MQPVAIKPHGVATNQAEQGAGQASCAASAPVAGGLPAVPTFAADAFDEVNRDLARERAIAELNGAEANAPLLIGLALHLDDGPCERDLLEAVEAEDKPLALHGLLNESMRAVERLLSWEMLSVSPRLAQDDWELPFYLGLREGFSGPRLLLGMDAIIDVSGQRLTAFDPDKELTLLGLVGALQRYLPLSGPDVIERWIFADDYHNFATIPAGDSDPRTAVKDLVWDLYEEGAAEDAMITPAILGCALDEYEPLLNAEGDRSRFDPPEEDVGRLVDAAWFFARVSEANKLLAKAPKAHIEWVEARLASEPHTSPLYRFCRPMLDWLWAVHARYPAGTPKFAGGDMVDDEVSLDELVEISFGYPWEDYFSEIRRDYIAQGGESPVMPISLDLGEMKEIPEYLRFLVRGLVLLLELEIQSQEAGEP